MKASQKLKFISWLTDTFFSDKPIEEKRRIDSLVFHKLKEFDYERPPRDPNQTHIFYE